MHPRWLAVLALATIDLLAAGWASRTRAPSASTVHVGCPPAFTGYDARAAIADDAIAGARTVAIDHVVENNQGRLTRRTRRKYPVVEAVELATGPALPGQKALKELATKRCGRAAALASWAVVFSDTESSVCCVKDVRFAVRLEQGWWVF